MSYINTFIKENKAIISLFIGFVFLSMFINRIFNILSSLFGLTSEAEQEQQIKETIEGDLTSNVLNNQGLNYEQIKRDGDVLFEAFGWNISLSNFTDWFTEDEETILMIVHKYNRITIEHLKKYYKHKTDGRNLHSDCKRYLSTSQYNEVKHIFE